MADEKALRNFETISKLMKNYIILFYKEHEHDSNAILLKYNNDNIETFEKNVIEQAIKMIKKMKSSCTPDRHKIIAVCLKSFISANIFCFDKEQYSKSLDKMYISDDTLSPYIIYPNEIFCIEVISIILNEYARYKNINDYKLLLANNIVGLNNSTHNYVLDLFKLILGYENNSLDFVVQELAHIIFFIEMGYEISIKGLSHKYYKM